MLPVVVQTEKYVFGGSCISKLANGKTLFVPLALPDERLKVEIVKERTDYCEGRVVDILVPSPYRVVPKCKYFSFCGGCDLQMISNAEQHRLREMSTKELMERSHIKLDFPIEFVSKSDWQYRNRFQLHRHNKKIGFLGRRGHSIVHVKDCPIACEEMRKYLKASSTFDDKEVSGSAKIERLHAFGYNGNLWLEERDDRVKLKLLGRDFAFFPQSFFQSNVEMLGQLVAVLTEYIGSVDRLLDFYSGIGTFSVFFANNAKELHLVEWNKYSVEMARVNLEKAKTESSAKIFFHCLNSEKWREKKEAKLFYDVAIVDPPRSGIDKVSLGWFCRRNVQKILYVSCDPATFSRDASFLVLNAGYKLQRCYFLDFYPQTHHLEVLGIFTL